MSTFTWIDHSEKQRRQILEAIDQFREKDSRDELGIAGIRDAFSDMLFPGTGSLQTRARYFFFVPWMYLGFEAKGVPSAEIARRARDLEVKLINTLAGSSDPPPPGTIGILARSSLQRFPSSIYWNGLRVLGICLSAGSQAEYHRSLDRLKAAGTARRNDDGEVVGGVARTWHAGLPAIPDDFPNQVTFALTQTEARYLKGRVMENHRRSLFAFLLDREYADADVDFAWDHASVESAQPELQREINHARCFSEVMNGAAIFYNLYLAELEPRREEVIESCTELLRDWLALMIARRRDLQAWDRADFWKLLEQRMYVPRGATRPFVEEWCRRVLNDDPSKLRDDRTTMELISRREIQIKGDMARFSNRRSREMWMGDAGLGRMDFRWSNARVILRDIADGLGDEHA
jgi:hypothetical protein